MNAEDRPPGQGRLRRVASYGLLDTGAEPQFDAVARLAAEICGTPVALISLVDRERQWFKSGEGHGPAQTPRGQSICCQAILGTEPLVIADTAADPRTADNPRCIGDGAFRFYAGAPITDGAGLPLGTLCVMDTAPRTLTTDQERQLALLAEQVMHLITMRQAAEAADKVVRQSNHRIRNALQVAAATLRRHRRALDKGADPADALRSVERTLAATAELHDVLAAAGRSGRVEIADFVARVIELSADQGAPHAADVALQPCRLGADRAVALGTVLTEFATLAALSGTGGNPVCVAGTFLDDGRYRLDLAADAPASADPVALRIIDGAVQQLGATRLEEAGPDAVRLSLAFQPD